jgi:outer membrane protein assembly factor BamB
MTQNIDHNTPTIDPTTRKPLRLWPGVAAAVLLVLVRFGLPLVIPDGAILGVLGAAVCGLLIALWWLFFSRAPWLERVGAIVLMIVGTYASYYIVHESISGGFMGRMLPLFLAIPGFALALVVWAAASRGLATGPRRAALVVTILLTCGAFALLRTDGVIGEASAQITWRWTPTAEERLLAQAPETPTVPASATPASPSPAAAVKPADEPAATKIGEATTPRGTTPPAAPASAPPSVDANAPDRPAGGERAVRRAEWPGFRGSDRDGVVRGIRIGTDWSTSPPVALWRRPIGPGWSSFAVQGDLLYTQEQRGEDEIVACYSVTTGKPVWMHKDPARFYESNGGAGPRATPALSDGRVYTLGATGILNALDAGNGAVVWTRNAVSDAGVKVPGWGIAGSPLVIDDLVVVAASGALVAYDRATGSQRWFVKSEGGSYSSPHLVTIDGTPQVLMLAGAGATSVAPADGTVLWKHSWAGSPIVQPAVTADGEVLLTSADAMGGLGIRRIAVKRSASGWTVEERWSSRGLKPYFSHFVVHKGHAFGFDGSILSAIELAGGERKWKGGRYGNGQMVLLADQDLLLVLSEEGELALVSATPDKYTEIARSPAIEGKTWTQPVLIGDILLVRNGEEMAAFRLPVAGR